MKSRKALLPNLIRVLRSEKTEMWTSEETTEVKQTENTSAGDGTVVNRSGIYVTQSVLKGVVNNTNTVTVTL
jgi:hypothetical protein